MKKYSENYIRIFNAIAGLLFCFYLVKLNIIYLLIASCCFYFTKYLTKFGEKPFVLICWIELFLVKYIIRSIYMSIEINKVFNIEKKDSMDDLTWEILFIYALLKMVSFNLEYKSIYFNQTIAESIFNINQAKSHCMQCYDGNFCAKCLENTVVEEKEKIDNSFNLIYFINYIFYPPLLFGGPLINYNSFIFQQNIQKESQHNDLFKMNKILYTIELLFLFGVMEIYNHFLFPIFLFKNKEDLIEPNSDITLFYYCFICLNILTFLWLKYAIIWKSFRLWA
jgi:hypothetical protein